MFLFFLCDFLGCSMHSAPFRTEYFMQIKKKEKGSMLNHEPA